MRARLTPTVKRAVVGLGANRFALRKRTPKTGDQAIAEHELHDPQRSVRSEASEFDGSGVKESRVVDGDRPSESNRKAREDQT